MRTETLIFIALVLAFTDMLPSRWKRASRSPERCQNNYSTFVNQVMQSNEFSQDARNFYLKNVYGCSTTLDKVYLEYYVENIETTPEKAEAVLMGNFQIPFEKQARVSSLSAFWVITKNPRYIKPLLYSDDEGIQQFGKSLCKRLPKWCPEQETSEEVVCQNQRKE